MKNCEYYEELIGAALDGEITAEEEAELRAHLEGCEACRSFYEAMQAIAGTDDALGDVPEGFTANVMARVREAAAPDAASAPEEKAQKKKASITRLVMRCGALAAAAAVAIWAGATFAGTFAAKSADSAAPEIAMYSAAGDSAETEKEAARDAAPAEAPASGMMMAAAPESAGANDAGASVTIAAEKEDFDAVTRPDDGFFAGYLLLDEGETDAPEREADYTLTLTPPDGEARVYRLWVGESKIVWQAENGENAHLSPAAPEALAEYLNENNE